MKLYQKVSIYGLYKAFIHKKLMIFLCAKVELRNLNFYKNIVEDEE